MSRKITYSTGRTYDAPQVLQIELLQSEIDEFGFVFGKALFVDHSRHIAGTVDFFSLSNANDALGKAVLSTYDSGDYSAKIFSHFA